MGLPKAFFCHSCKLCRGCVMLQSLLHFSEKLLVYIMYTTDIKTCTNTQANCPIIYGVRSYKEQLKYDLKALHYIFFVSYFNCYKIACSINLRKLSYVQWKIIQLQCIQKKPLTFKRQKARIFHQMKLTYKSV